MGQRCHAYEGTEADEVRIIWTAGRNRVGLDHAGQEQANIEHRDKSHGTCKVAKQAKDAFHGGRGHSTGHDVLLVFLG